LSYNVGHKKQLGLRRVLFSFASGLRPNESKSSFTALMWTTSQELPPVVEILLANRGNGGANPQKAK